MLPTFSSSHFSPPTNPSSIHLSTARPSAAPTYSQVPPTCARHLSSNRLPTTGALTPPRFSRTNLPGQSPEARQREATIACIRKRKGLASYLTYPTLATPARAPVIHPAHHPWVPIFLLSLDSLCWPLRRLPAFLLHSFRSLYSNPSSQTAHPPAQHARPSAPAESLIPSNAKQTMPFDRFRHGRRR